MRLLVRASLPFDGRAQLALPFCCIALAGFFAAIMTAAGSVTSPTETLPRGIYWLMSTGDDSGLASGIAPAYVDGATLRYRWKDLETADGTYNWTMLDNDLVTIAAAGKKAQLLIAVGNQTPCWVKNAGAAVYANYATFDSNCVSNPTEAFLAADSSAHSVVPLPWDPTYEAKWGAFIATMGAYISATGRMGLISGVVVAGVARVTAETNLPNPTDTPGWTAVGYTRAKVESAYLVFLNDWAAAFPNIGLSTRYTYGSFPDNFQPAGCPPVDHLFPRDLNDIAFANYPTLSIIGYNGINSSTSTTMPGNLLQQMCGMKVPSGSLWTDCEAPAESCQLGVDYNTFQGPSYTPLVSYEGLQEDFAVGNGNFGQVWTTASSSLSRLLFIEVYLGDLSAGNIAALTTAHNALTGDTLPVPTSTPTPTPTPTATPTVTPTPTPTPAPSSISVSPSSLAFGSQSVGTTSTPKAVTLTNNEAVAVTINAITITGRNATDFAMSSSTCGALGSGLTCTISVTFTPTAKAKRTGTLTISDTPDAKSPHAVGLSGKGV